MSMKSHYSTVLISLFLIASLPLALFAEPIALEQSTSSEQEHQLLLSYYPEPFVEEVLRAHGIDESISQEIANDLQNQDEKILQKVDESLQKLQKVDDRVDSPFFQLREEEVRAMHKTLQELFVSTLEEHQIADTTLAIQMFEEIQSKKAELFARAIKKSR